MQCYCPYWGQAEEEKNFVYIDWTSQHESQGEGSVFHYSVSYSDFPYCKLSSSEVKLYLYAQV